MLQPAPISISDRFSAIAEPTPVAHGSQEASSHLIDEPGGSETHKNSIDIPIGNLIVAKPRKLRPNRARLRKKFAEVHNAGCGCCPTAATTSLHSAWAKRRAIMNYEKFMNSEYGSNLDWATNIETVAATSLGVEGWALHDVGTLED
jgi:hypothetical protein